jgi:hypothetical protein
MQKNENWQSAEAYAYIDDLGPLAYAWEFLRRNPDYRGEAALFAKRWGFVANPDQRADHALIDGMKAP